MSNEIIKGDGIKEKQARGHREYWAVIVSKEELINQLKICSQQENLLKLLIGKSDCPTKEELLTKISVKFEFLGSLFYPFFGYNKKLLLEIYIKYLLEWYYETPQEVKVRIEAIKGEPVTLDYAVITYKKLVVAMYCCCLCISDVLEVWWDGTYRTLIEYAMDNKFKEMPLYENIMEYFPNDFWAYEGKREYLMRYLPKEIVSKLKNNDTTDYNFRF